jgi:hypothetical protein
LQSVYIHSNKISKLCVEKRGRVEECSVAPLRDRRVKTLCGCMKEISVVSHFSSLGYRHTRFENVKLSEISLTLTIKFHRAAIFYSKLRDLSPRARLSGSRFRSTTSLKIWYRRESNPDLWISSQELWPIDHRGGQPCFIKDMKWATASVEWHLVALCACRMSVVLRRSARVVWDYGETVFLYEIRKVHWRIVACGQVARRRPRDRQLHSCRC